jgi:hypothetical protein
VQGWLRGQTIRIEIETSCACCRKPLHVALDGNGTWSVDEPDAAPLVFLPEIDWATFTEPTIVDDF